MLTCLSWASWNGATFYIDVFGRRMEKELEHLRKEVARMAKSPELNGQSGMSDIGSPMTSPAGPTGTSPGMGPAMTTALDLGPAATETPGEEGGVHHRGKSFDAIPPLDGEAPVAATPGVELKKTLESLSGPPPVLGEKANGVDVKKEE
jgi:hypothetical protein